jgi:hypothetical protein
MAAKEEKKERRSQILELKKQDRARLEAELPMSRDQFKKLFDQLDQKVSEMGCDHTLLHTRQFLKESALPEDDVVRWLADHGGYCDCEVLANVEDALTDVL